MDTRCAIVGRMVNNVIWKLVKYLKITIGILAISMIILLWVQSAILHRDIAPETYNHFVFPLLFIIIAMVLITIILTMLSKQKTRSN